MDKETVMICDSCIKPHPVPTYYPITRIEQDGEVKGTIEATCKVME